MSTIQLKVISPHGNIFNLELKGDYILVSEVKKQIQEKYGYDASRMSIRRKDINQSQQQEKEVMIPLSNESEKITKEMIGNDENNPKNEFYADNLFFESISNFVNEPENYSEYKAKYGQANQGY